MSGPVYGTYPTDDFSRVKRSLQGTPVNLPTAQPGNAGREVGAGGAVKRPKFSPSSRHNSGSNVTIPYPRLFPFKASNPRIGRVDKGDVLFTERPLTTERTLTQNKCGFNSQIGSHSSVLGLDAVNRRLHGSTVDARWVFGVNFCVLKRTHSRTERNNAVRDLKEFQRWSLDGVVLGNDDVQTSRGLDASSDILFNVVVQGPAQVNNGYAMHTVVQGNTSDPGILSHKHPRGSFEAHLSGINTTVNPTTSSVSLNNSKYTGCNTRYPLQMFDRTPKPLDTLYLCARCFKLGDKTSLGEENIDIFEVNGKPRVLDDDDEAYFVQYMPSSMREIDGLHSTLRGMGDATFKDATGPDPPDPTAVPFRNNDDGIPKADESMAWHQWRAKTLAGGYARGLTDVFATILTANERVRNISFAHDGSVAMSTHQAPKRTKFYTADRDGGDVKELKPVYHMFDQRILAMSKHVLLVLWNNKWNQDTVTIFDTSTSDSRTVIQFPVGIRASCLDVSADTKTVVGGYTKTVVGGYEFKVFVKPFNNGLVQFLTTGTGAGDIKKILLPTPTNCVRISLDGQFFVSSDGGTGTTPANVRVWDIARGHEIKRMNNAVSGSINALDITDDGSLVVSGGYPGTVTTWSLLGDDDAYHVLSPVTGDGAVSVFFGRASDNNITVTASVGVNAYESKVYKWTLTLPPPPNAPYHSYDLDDLKHTVGHYTVGRVMDTQAVRSKNHDVGISEYSICVTADVNIRWSLDTIEIGDADSDLRKHLTKTPVLELAYPVSRFSLKPGRTVQPGGLVIAAPSAGDASLDEEIVGGPAATGEATLSAATIGSPALAAVSVATAATAKLPAASPAPVAAPTSARPPAPAPSPAPVPSQTLAPPLATTSALAPALVSSPNPVPTRIPDPVPALARVSTPTAAPRPPRPPAPTPTAARAPASNPTPAPAPAPALPPAPVPSPTGAPAPIATRSSTPSTSRGKAQAKSRVQTGGQRPDQAQVASVQTEVAAPAPVQEVPTSTTYRAPTGGASATRSSLSGANTGTSVSKEVDRLFNQLWGS